VSRPRTWPRLAEDPLYQARASAVKAFHPGPCGLAPSPAPAVPLEVQIETLERRVIQAALDSHHRSLDADLLLRLYAVREARHAR